MSAEALPWEDSFAPVTSKMGFLRAPLDVVSEGLLAWRREVHGAAEATSLPGGFPENVSRLEPLTGGVRPRELVVATANPEWAAVFDCGVHGGDPITTVGYLAQRLMVQGVVVVSIPDVPAKAGRPQRFGTRQFELFAPIPTTFMNYVRTISVVRDGDRWRFDANGTVQDFEDVSAYRRRRIADRFTSDMLRSYASALGLMPCDGAFFGGPSVLISNPSTPPPGGLVLSLRETQLRAGILAP
jgi:hypothetical protein